MPLLIVDIERFDSDGHTWCAVRPVDDEKWIEYLAIKYRDLRTEPIVPLSDLIMDGITVLSCDAIKHRLANAVLPTRGLGILSVARSDFGETISYCLLEDYYSTRFGYKSIRDRELVQLPGRGIDAIGVECLDQERLHLVLGETKTSTDHRSPPQVVDSAPDSLRAQHRGHLSEIGITCRKVWDAARRARDKETQELLIACALYLEEKRWDKLSLVAFSCLVRPRSLYKTTDYGSFRQNPDQFCPCKIRFTAFCVPSDEIEIVVDEWLNLARGREVEQ